jgi:DNA modification methylase
MTKLTLIKGDALKVLPTTQSESIDLVLTDPPYGISREVKISRKRNLGKFRGNDIVMDFGEWDKFKDQKEFYKFTFSWVRECTRVLRNGGMFITYFDRDKINFLSYFLQHHGFKTKGYFAHIKRNPVPQARKVKWENAWEEVGLWQKEGGKLTYNYQFGEQPDYMIVPVVSGKERLEHPTQKPEKVIELFVKYWSNEGDTVLDPFLGSGTTMVVCRNLKRNCIGIEINDNYIEMTKKRLNWGSTLGNVEFEFKVM